jgi:predicted DNA-binding transcriptional regulator AlpA
MRSSSVGPEEIKDMLTAQEVADRLAISIRTLYRLRKMGAFPAPVRYNQKLVRWSKTDIDAYIIRLKAEEARHG